MARILAFMVDSLKEMTIVAMNKVETSIVVINEEEMITTTIEGKSNNEQSTTKLKIKNKEKIEDDFLVEGWKVKIRLHIW